MSNDKPPEIDLDFLRYATDIKTSKSLKKFIDSGREKREKNTRSQDEMSDSSGSTSIRVRSKGTRKSTERLG